MEACITRFPSSGSFCFSFCSSQVTCERLPEEATLKSRLQALMIRASLG